MSLYEYLEWAFVLLSLGSLIYFSLRWVLKKWVDTVRDAFEDQNTEL